MDHTHQACSISPGVSITKSLAGRPLSYGRAQRHGAPKTDFIVELPPCRPADSETRIRGLQQPQTCTWGMETRAGDVGRAWFLICLAHPLLCFIKKKNHKVTPLRTLGNRWVRSYSRAQLLGLEAAPGQRPQSEESGHLINGPASLCLSFTISGASPSPPRSPVQTQPPYSRVETHGVAA